MISADHFLDSGDGTAWMLLRRCPDPAAGSAAHWGGGHPCVYGCKALDRPCGTCEGDKYLDNEMVMGVTCDDCDGTGRHTFPVEVSFGPMTRGARIHRAHVVPGVVLPIDGQTDRNDAYICHFPEAEDRFVRYPEGWWGDIELDEEIVTLPVAAEPGIWAVLLQLHKETS